VGHGLLNTNNSHSLCILCASTLTKPRLCSEAFPQIHMKRHDSPKKLYSKITENKKNEKTKGFEIYAKGNTLHYQGSGANDLYWALALGNGFQPFRHKEK